MTEGIVERDVGANMSQERNSQLQLRFRSWGGRRPGAGRPKRKGSRLPHVTRPNLASRFPVHVTLKFASGVGKLRNKNGWQAVRAAMTAHRCTPGFRVCHFSMQQNHIHMVVEAAESERLSRGVQGLAIRLARGINRALGRSGKVFADRYHARILKTPREVKNTINYVLNNHSRHIPTRDGRWYLMQEDGCSSAAWFDGWRTRASPFCVATGPPPVSGARTWLLSVGWRRHGLLVPAYVPPRGGAQRRVNGVALGRKKSRK
ncbi:MAG: hypothetical protein A2289_11090 [Deltaproteobacteria bacterium RIFOXYA12_FULL_58_15]|nr:MAG: hypothetical protein A2289_11090 [Deltaproteobacteria bacterium RIFOXYA12_FULL_58_15]